VEHHRRNVVSQLWYRPANDVGSSVSARVNRSGQRFGRLLILGRSASDRTGKQWWLCKCDCGSEKWISANNMSQGRIRSCGCLKREVSPNLVHGHSIGPSTEYMTWATMVARCSNPGRRDYKYYGGRGISVCDRWRQSFPNFLADMGLKPNPLLSIDRINNDGNYEPGNCRWTTRSQQSSNQRKRGTA